MNEMLETVALPLRVTVAGVPPKMAELLLPLCHATVSAKPTPRSHSASDVLHVPAPPPLAPSVTPTLFGSHQRSPALGSVPALMVIVPSVTGTTRLLPEVSLTTLPVGIRSWSVPVDDGSTTTTNTAGEVCVTDAMAIVAEPALSKSFVSTVVPSIGSLKVTV